MLRRDLGRAIVLTLLLASASCAPSPARSEQSTAPFQVEEATIAELHAAITLGPTTCRAVVEAYIDARQGLQRRLHESRHRRRRRRAARHRLRARRRAAGVSDQDRPRRRPISRISDQYRGLPLDYGRMEPTVSDPGGEAADGHARRHPERRARSMRSRRSTSAASARSPARALRRASVDRAAARRRAGGVRGVSQAARRARTRRRARRAVRPQPGPRGAADVLRRHRLQGSVTTRRTCGRRRTTTSHFAMDVPPFDCDARRAAARQGRDHLRQDPRRTSSTPAPATPAARPRARTNMARRRPGDQRVGGPGLQSLRHRARAARIEQRLGRRGRRPTSSTIGICEQTGASCQGPASRNGIAMLLHDKGIMPDSGGIGNQWFIDRAGIHARRWPTRRRCSTR